MNFKLLSQIINGIGSILNIIGINIKDKRKVLIFFTFGNACVATALGLLGAKVGMIVQIIFVVETIINYFWEKDHDKYPLWLMIVYVIAPCIALAITYQSLWDVLPIMGSILFPIALLSKNFVLRFLNFLSAIVWIPYNIHFGQYVGTVSCALLAFMTLVAIVRLDIIEKRRKV